MLLGFKRQFEPFVLDGSKTHTIRAECKLSRKVGQRCDCYGDVRQKTMHLLGRWLCVKIETILIRCNDSGDWKVWIAGQRLAQDEMDLLAWRDGFRCFNGDNSLLRYAGCFGLMAEFWTKTHGKRRHKFLPKEVNFKGMIIHWDYRQPVTIFREKTA